MTAFRLLMTKKISPSLVLQAGLKGVEILEKEFISITRSMNEQLAKKINRLVNAKITAVFTSKNAVKAIADHLASPPDWKIFCIDGLTKEEVLKYFPAKSVAGTAINASQLAEIIVEVSDDKQVVFFCGNKRMEDLPSHLRLKEFEVDEIAVYKTVVTPQKIIDDYDGVAFFSPSAVESFFSVNRLKDGIVCFSVGNATTEKIKTYTSNRIHTSSRPSESDVLELVIGVAKAR